MAYDSLSIMRTFILFGFLWALSGCDAWPTVVGNRAESNVTVQYLHQDYDQWSAPFTVKSGFSMPLALAHWIPEIRGIRIKDGQRTYSWSATTMHRLAAACPGSDLPGRAYFVGDCYLIYLGHGRIKAVAERPGDLLPEQMSSGS
ncbi:hypothetical protein ACFSUK_14210 [Sphingobium scionense]|uniref:Uncharacterized protein n=1 Tax=Sphingobium scionense TaxID=1404341 RepID=A0A7W6PVC4_9SPHN|nr:hypothetical protein [Sphingobium scionense]MBB4149275.1 hypothetical protein [Sphingobium scionense]